MKKERMTTNAIFSFPEELAKRSRLTIPKKPAVTQAAMVQLRERLGSRAALIAMFSVKERIEKVIRNPNIAFLLTLISVVQYSLPRFIASFCSVDRGV